MRFKVILPAIIAFLIIPTLALAISQELVDRFEFLLEQPEWDMWDDGTFDDADLIEGFDIIYANAVAEEDDIMVRRVMWAMGVTGLTEFVDTLTDEMENEPIVVCYALGKIPSDDGVYALIEELDNDDEQVRDAAAWGLGSIPYTDEMDESLADAIEALYLRVGEEEEDWVLDTVEAAITLLETGIITDEGFIEEPE